MLPKRSDFEGDNEKLRKMYHNLMPFRVVEILLVSSFYDAFIIEEEGLISELLIGQYRHLLLSSPPRVTSVTSGTMAMTRLKERRYDLVITMSKNIGMDPYEFGKMVKMLHPDLPVILLATDSSDERLIAQKRDEAGIDKAFFWSGDSTLFLAIIKSEEDRNNARTDTVNGSVRVIVMVEDSIRYYSMLLPIFYTEIVRQTRRTLSEDLNEMQRLVTRRARPKILLAETFEEGMELFMTYKDYILGVITDMRYPREGKEDPDAGFELNRKIREVSPYTPVLIQSSDLENRGRAEAAGAYFLHKNSPTLLQDFRRFLLGNVGFGDFIFLEPKVKHGRKDKGAGGLETGRQDVVEIARASNMQEFVGLLQKVPLESIRYHAERNHFSNWLFARCEFGTAQEMRSKKLSDFTDLNEVRKYLLELFNESRKGKQRAVITDFSQERFEFESSFTKLTGDSLGGKGRGIAFIRSLLSRYDLEGKYKGIDIMVPSTVVIGTLEFERFIFENKLLKRLEDRSASDRVIAEAFLRSKINRELRGKLSQVLRHFEAPLAVRSSGLLEDSQDFPFAGVYRTYMLPNNHPKMEVRLNQLCQAIKLVYASVFYKEARAYIESTSSKVEEEKMAVVIQKVVGHDYGGRFYPTFSGVVQSINFYPVSHQTPEDGIASVAVGLGKTIVAGEKALRFSPRYPEIIPELSSTELALANTQTKIYALDTSQPDFKLSEREDFTLKVLDISDIRKDGSLDLLAGTYDQNDGIIRDGLLPGGPPVVTFSGILKYNAFPLCSLLKDALEIGEWGMGRPVELEFAVDLRPETGPRPVFSILQVRPLAQASEMGEMSFGEVTSADDLLIRSDKALGNWETDEIRDIVYVVPEKFDPSKTVEVADEIGMMNAGLAGSSVPYILIGPGRWGSQDRWLGIPVKWSQISGAAILVETVVKNFHIEPSQGTHFFQNMVAKGIGYVYVSPDPKSGFIDWPWIGDQEIRKELAFVRHVHVSSPLSVRINGRIGHARVMKPRA